jgi:hypothetical protein
VDPGPCKPVTRTECDFLVTFLEMQLQWMLIPT